MSETTEHHDVRNKRGRLLVVLTFALLAAVYLCTTSGIFIVNPDSCIYMTLGRSLAEGRGYTFNGAPYAKYPPVYPGLLAVTYLTAGGSIRAMQVLGALVGVGALAAGYRLLRTRVERRPALACTVLTAVCCWFMSHSALLIRSDIPYTMFALTSLWLTERFLRAHRFRLVHWVAVGVVGVLAIYTHMVGVVLVPAICGGVLLADARGRSLRQRLAAAATVGTLCTLAAALWLWHSGEAGESRSYGVHMEAIASYGAQLGLLRRLSIALRDWMGTPVNLTFVELSTPAAIGLFGAFFLPGYLYGLWRHRGSIELYLPAAFLVTTFAGGPHAHERYVLPAVLVLFYFGYESLALLGRAVMRLTGERRGLVILGRLVLIAGFVVLAFNGGYLRYKRRKGLRRLRSSWLAKDRERVARWREVASWIDKHVGPREKLFPASGASVSHLNYFADRAVIPFAVPIYGPDLLKAIAESGATYVLRDDEHRTRDRMPFLLDRYPECVEALETSTYVTKEKYRCTLYRLRRARLRSVLLEWAAAREWFGQHVSPGSPVFPSSTEAWMLAGYLADQHTLNPWRTDVFDTSPSGVLHTILDSGAAFVLADPVAEPARSFAEIRDACPDCFASVAEHPNVMVFRIDRARIEKAVGEKRWRSAAPWSLGPLPDDEDDEDDEDED